MTDTFMNENLKFLGQRDNSEEIKFFRRLNNSLIELEQSLKKSGQEEEYINIFILGLPRSGTTLLSQVIYSALDVYSTNNLIAKFWEVPIVGTRFSKALLGDRKSSSYESYYANTRRLDSPHEFSYFWRDRLLINDPYDYHPDSAAERINWDELRDTILNMNSVVKKGFVFKTLEYTAYHFEKFYNLLEKSLYVYIDRDASEMAKSIYQARKDLNEEVSDWWGSVPREYPSLCDQSFNEQIAGQIYYLRQMYDEVLSDIDNEDRVIKTSYEELCQAPGALVNEIRARAIKVYDESLQNVESELKPFDISINNLDEEITEKLHQSLNNYNLLQ